MSGSSDDNPELVAIKLVERHGESAVAIAEMRAEHYRDVMDGGGAYRWRQIAIFAEKYLERFKRGKP